jgi:hypothetical protein
VLVGSVPRRCCLRPPPSPIDPSHETAGSTAAGSGRSRQASPRTSASPGGGVSTTSPIASMPAATGDPDAPTHSPGGANSKA